MKSRSGFTIVELLIVIVVIAILAAISIVAYNGIQQRARDNSRSQTVTQIQKALELYKTEHGIYPAHIPSGTNIPAGFSGRWGSSTIYSYSVDTANNWMKNLADSEVVGGSLPVDPVNNNQYYFTYWASGSVGYGACKEPFYMLSVAYEQAASIPARSARLLCTEGSAFADWNPTGSIAVFSNRN